jgi:hypothetical protein
VGLGLVRGWVVVVEIPGPHTEISQGEQVRTAVSGRMLDSGAGGTIVVMWCPRRRGWAFYWERIQR